jgi:hypothetical protein
MSWRAEPFLLLGRFGIRRAVDGSCVLGGRAVWISRPR